MTSQPRNTRSTRSSSNDNGDLFMLSASSLQTIEPKNDAQRLLQYIRERVVALKIDAPEWIILPTCNTATALRQRCVKSDRLITKFLRLDRNVFVADLFEGKDEKNKRRTKNHFLSSLIGLSECDQVITWSMNYIRICFGDHSKQGFNWSKKEPELNEPYPPMWLSSILRDQEASKMMRTYHLYAYL